MNVSIKNIALIISNYSQVKPWALNFNTPKYVSTKNYHIRDMTKRSKII